jgi:hypothetical protein
MMDVLQIQDISAKMNDAYKEKKAKMDHLSFKDKYTDTIQYNGNCLGDNVLHNKWLHITKGISLRNKLISKNIRYG